jgi:uncharacterized protein (TIGR03437 family)
MRVLWGLAVFLPLLAQEARLNRIASGLTMPTDIQHAGDGSGRLFLVEQNGRIRIFRNGALAERPFLDVTGRVRSGGEQGLLGLAFPPGFAQKRYFYVNYTGRQGDTIVARYRLSSDPGVADAASEEVILMIDQPFSNHNGGQLRFGPDGYLYIGMGDGGSGGDPQNNGQRGATLLGKMLRIDVEGGASPYGVPPDNPFVATSGTRPEIWAFGLRNPWRFAFDRETADLWIADVGQNRAEEVNFTPAGGRGGENYGWNLMEGLQCFIRPNCDMNGLTLPVLEYGRGQGCSVTGGNVYRGTRVPALRGSYVYADYCSGTIWALRREGDRWANRVLLETTLNVSSFGEDEQGEMYVAGHTDGAIYAVAAVPGAAPSFSEHSVVNAASNVPGLVPGSLTTIYASSLRDTAGITEAPRLPLPVSLGDVMVLVNGRPAPLLAVASGTGGEQVNFQAPFELMPGTTASIVIRRGGADSAAVAMPVVAAQPGIFATGGTDAIAADANFERITQDHPAVRDAFIVLYATGLGEVENSPGTGNAAPSTPLARTRVTPQVRFSGTPAEVVFSGLAPGFAGLYQLNVRVPAGLTAGTADVVIEQAGAVSRPARIFVR